MRIHAWVVADQPQMQRECLEALERQEVSVSLLECDRSDWKKELLYQVKNTADPGLVILCLWQTRQIHAVVKQLREKLDIPVFVLHNRESYYEEMLCLQNGADDFQSIRRPFPLLWERMYRLLRLYQGKIRGVLYDHGLVEEPEQMQFFWQAKSLELTGREYLVLSLIVHSREDVIEKKKLLYHIWGEESDMEKSSRALDTVMKQLRRKIKTTPIAIETCYGIGYRRSWKSV